MGRKSLSGEGETRRVTIRIPEKLLENIPEGMNVSEYVRWKLMGEEKECKHVYKIGSNKCIYCGFEECHHIYKLGENKCIYCGKPFEEQEIKIPKKDEEGEWKILIGKPLDLREKQDKKSKG